MKTFVVLLVVVGLAVAGWFNREMISGWVSQKMAEATTTAETTPSSESEKPRATPNPAQEAVAQARRTYPALARPGSAFNLRFVALFNEMRGSDPDFLTQPKWPILLAERTARELGGAAMPLAGKSAQRPAQRIAGWTDNYAAAVESAKMENKKLLLDFTGSDWCEYCQALDREVLSSSKFQTWASDKLVLVKVDFPERFPQSGLLKQQNAELKVRYPFKSYPTILVVDTAGRVLSRSSGYNPGSGPDAFIAGLEKTVSR